MRLVRAVGHALLLSGSMMWGILWALILGFTLSAIVQAVVKRERRRGSRTRGPAIVTQS